MKTFPEIIIKEATKDKAVFVEENITAIIEAKEGKSKFKGFTINRCKNIFIIL